MTALFLLPPAAPPSDPAPRLLQELVATLYALWTLAPTEPLQWRAACALELAALRVPREEMVALPEGGLAELRGLLAHLALALDWWAGERRWWPALSAALRALLTDLGAHLAQQKAVA